jgi:hypothetical protein
MLFYSPTTPEAPTTPRLPCVGGIRVRGVALGALASGSVYHVLWCAGCQFGMCVWVCAWGKCRHQGEGGRAQL